MTNTQEQTDSAKSIHTITNALLEDLFNPSISTLDLCNLHGLSLPELAATLESETFITAKESFERINAARQHIIGTESAALASARLADILKDKPESPAHAETQRKAATKILSSFPQVGRASSPSSPSPDSHHETPPAPHGQATAGCHGLAVPGKPCSSYRPRTTCENACAPTPSSHASLSPFEPSAIFALKTPPPPTPPLLPHCLLPIAFFHTHHLPAPSIKRSKPLGTLGTQRAPPVIEHGCWSTGWSISGLIGLDWIEHDEL